MSWTFNPFTGQFDSKGSGGSASSIWGSITGTLSDQADLQDALDLKADVADLHDAVTILDTDTIDFGLSGQQITGSVRTQMSLTSDASGIKLSGDSASPGNSKYYGTDGSGVKGYFTLPSGSGSPGGSNTQIQFNDSGSFGGSSALVFDKTAKTLTLDGGTGTGTLKVNGDVVFVHFQTTGAGPEPSVLRVQRGTGGYIDITGSENVEINMSPASGFNATLKFATYAQMQRTPANNFEIQSTAGATKFSVALGAEISAAIGGAANENQGLYVLTPVSGGGRSTIAMEGRTYQTGPFIRGYISSLNRFLIDINGGAEFNIQGRNDADFKIQGDTDANLFFSDASADKIGIGTSTPSYKLDVVGDINISSGSLFRVNGSQISTSNVLEGTNLYYTDERVDDRVNTLLQAGSNITLTYNDAANTLTIASSGGGNVSYIASLPRGGWSSTTTFPQVMYACSFYAPVAMTATKLQTYLPAVHATTPGTIEMGIYDASGAKLGSGTVTPTAATPGLYQVTGLSISLTAGTKYFFAIVNQSASDSTTTFGWITGANASEFAQTKGGVTSLPANFSGNSSTARYLFMEALA